MRIDRSRWAEVGHDIRDTADGVMDAGGHGLAGALGPVPPSVLAAPPGRVDRRSSLTIHSRSSCALPARPMSSFSSASARSSASSGDFPQNHTSAIANKRHLSVIPGMSCHLECDFAGKKTCLTVNIGPS
ncbi:MAG: hypothetical protein ABW022_23265 [Actinoplanes sp.]